MLVALLVALVAVEALAHGGGGFRGPPGPPPDGCAEPWDAPPMPPPARYGDGPVVARILGSDGEPLVDATVWCERSPVARTGDDGRFRCAPLRYPARLTVLARGHAALILVARVRPRPGAHLDLGDARLTIGGDVRGRIEKDDDDWDRIRVRVVPEGVRVPEAFAAIGDVNGWNGVWVRPPGDFVFRGLPEGRYRLVVGRAGGPQAALPLQVRPGCDPVTIHGGHVPRRPAPEEGTLDGRLTLTGIAGRDVAVVDRDRACQIVVHHDRDSVTVNVPDDSDLDVIVQDDAGLELPLEGLRAGQTVALPPPTTRTVVEGVVVRPDGSPVVRARVWAAAHADVRGAFRRETWTDAEGRFRVDGTCGLLRVHASAPGLTDADRPCTVVAGDRHARVMVEEEVLTRIPVLRLQPEER
jgi:hypothetical protein